jgi:hypothetical protein
MDFFKKSDIPEIIKNVEWDRSVLSFEPESGAVEINNSIIKGQVVGKAVYSLDGKTLFEVDLQAGEDIKMRTFLETAVLMIEANYINYLIGAGAVILLIILVITLAARVRKHKEG